MQAVFKCVLTSIGRFTRERERHLTTVLAVQIPNYGQIRTESKLFRALSRRHPTFPLNQLVIGNATNADKEPTRGKGNKSSLNSHITGSNVSDDYTEARQQIL